MATLKLYLDTRKIGKDGTAPVKLSINHKGGSALMNLDIRIRPEQWNGYEIIKHPQKHFLNSTIAEKKLNIEKKLIKICNTRGLCGLDATQLKYILETDEMEATLFVPRFVEYMGSRKAERTRNLYNETLKRMRAFDGGLDAKVFNDIDRVWLKKFDDFLSITSPSANARNIHFRNIRAVFNDAIDDELDIRYPFRKFKIKPEPTAKRSLTVDELRSVMHAELPPRLERYRDIFVLMFYLIGINTVDLCNLKGISGDRIEYRRSKTGKPYSIKVEPEAAALIQKYKGNGPYLLDILDRHGNYLYFSSKMNKRLHEIKPGLSAYWARHTWATIAAELDIPKETIAAGLGHELGNSTTAIYINFNMKKVDEANRRIIDYVLGKRQCQ